MRRHSLWVCVAAIVLAACSSSGSKASPSTSTSSQSTSTSVGVTTTPSTTPVNPSTTAAPAVTSTTVATACPQPALPATPVTTPKSSGSSLLTSVNVASNPCADKVIFGYLAKSGGTPNCSVGYKSGPFVEDGSGKPVTVAGAVFVAVRCSPAYGYDFQTGRTTYTGSKHITPSGTTYVRALAETGDFEGVVTWVVGLSSRRGFKVAVATIPPGVSTLTITFL